MILTLFQTSPGFYMLETVFSTRFWELSAIFIKFETVVLKLFQFEKV